MKKVIKLSIFALISVSLTACGSSNKEISSSNKTTSKTTSSINRNSMFLNSGLSIDSYFEKNYSYKARCEIGSRNFDIEYLRQNEYIIYKNNDTRNFITASGSDMYSYSKVESEKYNSLEYISGEEDFFNSIINNYLGNKTIYYSNKENKTYLNRNSIEYTFDGTNGSSFKGNLIVDTASGMVLYSNINSILKEDNTYEDLVIKIEVSELNTSVSNEEITNEIQNINIKPLENNYLNKLGINGEMTLPDLRVKSCKEIYKNNVFNSYSINYFDNVNSGNDQYVNKFKTLVTSLYEIGFNKSIGNTSDTYIDKTYEELIIDNTIDYDSDLSFESFYKVDLNVYKVNSTCTVKNRIANIGLTISKV